MSSKETSEQAPGANSSARATGPLRSLLSIRTGVTLVWLVLFGIGVYAPCTVYRLLPGIPLLHPRHIVDVGYAKYLGKQTLPNTVAYLGIPYAEPPVGELRFRKPVPVSVNGSPSGVIDATTYPDFCVQGYAPWAGPDDRGGAGSEDCLKVNVYTPICAKQGDALPVLVYIHGGGYFNGNPRNWPFDEWLNTCPQFIAVHIYYRLTAFGFLAAPAPSGTLDLNVGLHDQREALRWVKGHISAFGGDPERVTIVGQSAGGGSVWLQMLADEATREKLFHAAIPQSLSRSVTPVPERKRESFLELARKAGCSRDTISESISCLREASISAIVRASDDLMKEGESPYHRWMPVIDGELIVDDPTQLFLQGKFVRVPVLVGHTTDDGNGGVSLAGALQTRFPFITEEAVRKFEQLYPEEYPNRVANAFGEATLRCGTHLLGKLMGNVFAYRWNQPTPPLRLPAPVWHSSDNYMLFQGTSTGSNGSTIFHPLSTEQRDFFNEVLAYFVSFVRSGDPNMYKLNRSPTWPPYSDKAHRAVLQHQPQGDLTKDASDETGTSAVWIEDLDEGEISRCEALFEMSTLLEN